MGKPGAQRRQAKQARAQATIQAIYEATTQILETDGEPGFNTNRVAERAGVSVGTLYQYFADKQAILVAMAMAENAAVRRVLAQAPGDLSPHRRAIRAQLTILADRPATRRAALKAIQAAEGGRLVRGEEDAAFPLLPRPADRDELELYVIRRAVLGVIRAAVAEGSPHLDNPRFEDALVRLAKVFG